VTESGHGEFLMRQASLGILPFGVGWSFSLQWIDSHCHLDFDDYPDSVGLIKSLQQAGCQRVLVPAISAQYFDRLLSFKKIKPDFIDIALGLHPYFLKNHKISHLDALVKAVEDYSPRAIGEIGLDYMLDESGFNKQLELFSSQLAIAKQNALPIVVHCRKAHDPLLKLVKAEGITSGGFIHGFSGSKQQAKHYLDAGFILGLGGALTHERAKAMQRLVVYLPDDGFVLETDSPDMAPSFAKEAINTPLNVPKIAEHIASLRGQSLRQIFELTNRNYHRTF
jgi:TatD DNase family protein